MRCFISRLSYAVVKVLLNSQPKLSLRGESSVLSSSKPIDKKSLGFAKMKRS
jgi:hypothetical protein